MSGFKHILFSIFVYCSILYSNAQDNSEFHTWTDFNDFHWLSARSAVGGDIGIRGALTSEDWTQYYIRPTYRYVINEKFDFAGGLAYFRTNNTNYTDLDEFRIFQQASISWPNFTNFWFEHRFRAEQRFFDFSERLSSGESSSSSNRLRYQLSVQSSDFQIGNQTFYSGVSAEYFYTADDDSEYLINQSRLVFALGYRFNGTSKIELNYILQGSRIGNESELRSTEHILRVRYYITPRAIRKMRREGR